MSALLLNLIVQTLVICFPGTALAGEHMELCEIKQQPTLSSPNRVASILFPDGRSFTIVGQLHGHRENQFRLDALNESPALFSQVREILNQPEAQSVLLNDREDVDVLKSSIAKGSKFIGVEMDEKFVSSWRQAVRDLNDRLLRHSISTGESDSTLISNADLFLMGAPFLVQMTEPALFKSVEIRGLEDTVLMSRDHEALTTLSAAFQELNRAANGNKTDLEEFAKLDFKLEMQTYQLYNPSTAASIQKSFDQLVAKIAKPYKPFLAAYLNAMISYYKTLSARDSLTAERLLATNMSGIHFIGAIHMYPILNRLHDGCIKMIPTEGQIQNDQSAKAIK